jgi:hypothetical protein
MIYLGSWPKKFNLHENTFKFTSQWFFLIIRFERYSFKNLWSIPKIRKMILKKMVIDQSCKVLDKKNVDASYGCFLESWAFESTWRQFCKPYNG